MATIYMNGFEWNSYYENILSWYGATIVDDYPLSGNYCLRIGSYDHYIRWQTTPVQEFYIQLGLKLEGGYNDGNIFKWQSGTNILGTLTFDPFTQTLSIYRGDKSVKLGTSSQQLLYNQWYCIEIHVSLSVTSGTIVLKIDGETQFTFNGVTTPNDTSAYLWYIVGAVSSTAYYTTSSHFYIDDVVINDTTGSNNNSWPNGAKIVLLFPTGRGNSSQWEKIAHLDNYENVDKYPSLDPADYLYTNINERIDLYLVNNLPVDAFSVAAARIDAWALKNSGSDLMLNLVLRTNDVDFISGDNELGVSYALKQWLHQQNPGTSVNWTVADINELEGGMRSIVPE